MIFLQKKRSVSKNRPRYCRLSVKCATHGSTFAFLGWHRKRYSFKRLEFEGSVEGKNFWRCTDCAQRHLALTFNQTCPNKSLIPIGGNVSSLLVKCWAQATSPNNSNRVVTSFVKGRREKQGRQEEKEKETPERSSPPGRLEQVRNERLNLEPRGRTLPLSSFFWRAFSRSWMPAHALTAKRTHNRMRRPFMGRILVATTPTNKKKTGSVKGSKKSGNCGPDRIYKLCAFFSFTKFLTKTGNIREPQIISNCIFLEKSRYHIENHWEIIFYVILYFIKKEKKTISIAIETSLI